MSDCSFEEGEGERRHLYLGSEDSPRTGNLQAFTALSVKLSRARTAQKKQSMLAVTFF